MTNRTKEKCVCGRTIDGYPHTDRYKDWVEEHKSCTPVAPYMPYVPPIVPTRRPYDTWWAGDTALDCDTNDYYTVWNGN